MSGFGGLLGVSGEGGLSASGGNAGPARSGVGSTDTFNVGGNAGIGSSTGLDLQTIAIIGLIGIALFITLTRGKR